VHSIDRALWGWRPFNDLYLIGKFQIELDFHINIAEWKRTMKNILLTTAITFAFAAPSFGAGTHEPVSANVKTDNIMEMSVGAVGKLADVDRTISVSLLENDEGQMLIESEELVFAKGETILFKIENKGVLEHEFVLDTLENNAGHKEEMREMAGMDMKHEDPNRILLDAGTSKDFVWTFENDGVFQVACLIPGHFESGMYRELIVNQ